MLKPLGDRVVLKIEEKEQTVGGFVLAGSAQEKTKTAQVVATGQGVRTLNGDLVAPSVKTGDSFNYAIHPEYSKTLRLARVIHIKIMEGRWRILEIGDINNDEISWRSPSSDSADSLDELLPKDLEGTRRRRIGRN